VNPKESAARVAAGQVRDGMIVGLGSGSTAELAIRALASRQLNITGIPTSERTAVLAHSLGIRLGTLEEHPRIDLTIDGADQVELKTLNLIKGRGGALLHEKIVASASDRLLIVVDEGKLTERLNIAVPVEVIPFGWETTARRLQDLGSRPELRPDFRSDEGNLILECDFGSIESPEGLAARIDGVVGVVEHGLFLGLTPQVIVGAPNGASFIGRESRP
jgi:ribose 5-phosphate isomerase A